MNDLRLPEDMSEAAKGFDARTIPEMDDNEPYALIDILLRDIQRMGGLVMDARGEVNRLSRDGYVYDLLAENVFDGSYFDHPALKRYIDLYGECAFIPWEH